MKERLDIAIYNRPIPGDLLKQMFDILFDNMSQISIMGGNYEEDAGLWITNAAPYIEHVAVASNDNQIAGYFQYRFLDNTLYMDEFQIRMEYQGSGLFRQILTAVTELAPTCVGNTEACVEKGNIKSQQILEMLGLNNVGETESGNSYVYRGEYAGLKSYINKNNACNM